MTVEESELHNDCFYPGSFCHKGSVSLSNSQVYIRFPSLRYGSLPVSAVCVYVKRCSVDEMGMTIYLTCLVIVL